MIRKRGRFLFTTAELAHHLGVSVNAVRSWHRRRDSNGFPEHECIERAKNGMDARHWDFDTVRDWWIERSPQNGDR